MIFMLHCRLLPGQAARLSEFRAAHQSHVQSSPIKLLTAGPTRDESGEIIGGLYVFEADSRAVADALYDDDPYVMNGLWRKTVLEIYDKRI